MLEIAPQVTRVQWLGRSVNGWHCQGWAALHQWLPVLRSQHLSAATTLPVLQSRIAPRPSYGTKLRRPAANMTAVLTRAAQLVSGIHREASHAAVFEDSCVQQDVMLVNPDVCQVTFATVLHPPRRCTRALTRVCIPALDTDLSPAYAPPDCMEAAT